MFKKYTLAGISLSILASTLFGFTSDYITNYDIDAKCDKLLHNKAYDSCYSYSNKTPRVVVYKVYDAAGKKHYNRKHIRFKPDYRIKAKYRSYSRDFSHTGFDRGHNCPNAAKNTNKELQRQTFLLSNIAPQKPQLNRKYWAHLERYVRMLAHKFGSVEVATGTCGSLGHIKNRVNIPAYWYKIIFKPNGTNVAFLAPNTNNGMSRAKLKKYLSSIAKIEDTCGYKILPKISVKP